MHHSSKKQKIKLIMPRKEIPYKMNSSKRYTEHQIYLKSCVYHMESLPYSQLYKNNSLSVFVLCIIPTTTQTTNTENTYVLQTYFKLLVHPAGRQQRCEKLQRLPLICWITKCPITDSKTWDVALSTLLGGHFDFTSSEVVEISDHFVVLELLGVVQRSEVPSVFRVNVYSTLFK